MRYARRVVCISAAVVSLLFPAVARAQGDGARTAIVVRVRSADGEALPARVLVIGTDKGQSYQRLTDGTAPVRFSVVSGRYWITAEARGYQSARETADVSETETRELTFTLVELRHIGSVRSRTDSSTVSSPPGATARRVSRDLADALSSIAGVSAARGDGAFGIRVGLQGADDSLTHFSYGGAPLPANAAALAIDTDLVQTVQVDQSRDLVQFSGLGATTTPTTHLRVQSGSYGASTARASFQDTFGSTGIAVLHSIRAEESPVNGAVFLDTSGESYRHVGAIHATGDYLKISAPVGSYAGSSQGSFSRSLASPLKTYFTGNVPAGTGPGEKVSTTAFNGVVALNGAVAQNSVALTYAEFRVDSNDDQPNRIVDDLAFPFALVQRTNIQTYSLTVERGISSRMTMDGSLQVFHQSTTSVLAGAASTATGRLYEATLGIHGAEMERGGWSAEYKTGRVDQLPYGSVSVRARRRISDALSFNGTASAGTIAQQGNDALRARGWVAPYEADFNCADRMIVAQGPGDAASAPHQLRLFGTAGWDRGPTRVSASAWYATTRDQLLSGAIVPLSSADASVPDGYAGALLAEANLPQRCGGIGPFSVFARRDVGRFNTTNRGLSVTVGRDLLQQHVDLNLELVSQRIDAVDPRLASADSVYFVGGQLLGVPPFRATLLVNGPLGKRSELLGSIHYEAANNRYNLRPFVATALGVSRRVGPAASLTVVAGNLFNNDAGVFVSPRFARPVPTAGGTRLQGVAAPLPPFRVSAQLDVRIAK
ncbi:MAG: hypothetical protein QOD51_379 [Candidatus Eremiobacteraeota bacterium]|nr:hypothetical protein [Candidatus Eremiobacteraeota bacterium]